MTIGGISGIENPQTFDKGFYETTPYDQDELKTVTHYRNYEI